MPPRTGRSNMANTHVTSFDEGSQMSTTQTVTCPNCQTILRSDRPLAAGARLRCPDCRKPFVAPEEPEETIPSTAPAAAPLVGAPLLIAVAVSLLLGGAIVTAAIIISPP